LRWATQSLLAHIERGLTVEVRFIETPPNPDPSDAERDAVEFATMKTVIRDLQFHVAEGQPYCSFPHRTP